jgi:hypothetical protein
MRVALAHFRHKPAGYVADIERSSLFCHHGVKEDLEEKITQFLPYPGIVGSPECVVKLVRLFDEVGA